MIDAIPDAELQEALSSLPEQYRRVVLLFDVEGFSYQEIARILGVPRGTVTSRLHRGRKALRTRMWLAAAGQHQGQRHGQRHEQRRGQGHGQRQRSGIGADTLMAGR